MKKFIQKYFWDIVALVGGFAFYIFLLFICAAIAMRLSGDSSEKPKIVSPVEAVEKFPITMDYVLYDSLGNVSTKSDTIAYLQMPKVNR